MLTSLSTARAALASQSAPSLTSPDATMQTHTHHADPANPYLDGGRSAAPLRVCHNCDEPTAAGGGGLLRTSTHGGLPGRKPGAPVCARKRLSLS
jgi:hypothetical protein